jgi:hypothetical protein
VRDPSALDVEGIEVRPSRSDTVTFEDDRLMARPGHGQRRREPRDAAAGDDELHTSKLPGRGGGRQAA